MILKNTKIFSFLYIVLFFVSPLLFFTNFTRNPYFFQIFLINISIALLLIITSLEIVKAKQIIINLSPLFFISLFIIFVFFISSAVGYFLHSDFFKPSIISENIKIYFFLIFNAFLPFFIFSQIEPEKEEIYYPYSIAFTLAWGCSWFIFKLLKTPDIFFDIYGGIVWLWGIFYLLKKTPANLNGIIHLAILSGFYASVYGVLQYFGLEIIWDKKLTPYGRRAVTTFGNPNFASSYMLMLLPFTFYYWIKIKNRMRNFYLITIFSFILMIFASLTRSTLIALIFEIFFLLIYSFKKKMIEKKDLKKFIFIFFMFSILWPDQNLNFFKSGVFKRFEEAVSGSIKKPDLTVKKENIYQSFHQRLLIWRCGLDMFIENPITGKGWGNFELFYPFYQGWYLRINPALKELRTHANNAHNEIIEIISQTGIAGLGAVILLFLSITAHVVKNRSDTYLVIMYISFLAMIIDNMLNVSIHFATPGLLFFTITGFISLKISYIKTVELKKLKYLTIFIIFMSIFYIILWVRYLGREIYYFAGFKEMRKSNYLTARNYLEKAFGFHRFEVNSAYELANCYVKNTDFNKAIDTYRYALMSNAGYDEIYFNLAIVEKNLSMYESASKNLRTSLWINPSNEKSYYAYAEISSKIHQENDIKMAVVEDGCINHPDDGYMMWICGYFAENERKDKDKAEYYYTRSVLLEPLNALYLNSLKRIKSDSIAFKFSELYKEVVAENKKYDPVYAERTIKEMENYFRDIPKFEYLRAKIMFDRGRFDESEIILKKILENHPDFSHALKSLAFVYEKMGKNELAILYYEKYLIYDNSNENIKKKIEYLKRLK